MAQRSDTPATDLVPAGPQPRASAAQRLDAAGFAELEPPDAGQYWRLARAIKEVNTKSARHEEMAKGTVLLIKEVETQIDGTPHVVHLAPHPDWYEAGRGDPPDAKFLYDDFLRLWERAPDAEQVRARELAALQSEMEVTQRAMLSPPPSPKIEGLLGHEPAPNEGGDSRALATSRGIHDLVAHAEATKADAEARVNWITEHRTELGGQTHRLARYHQERAESMLAQASARLKGLGKIHELVKNLKLYTGEEVSVMQVADGEPAAPDERLTFYQDVLALDEELLINLDGGGFSHHDVEDLPQVLADPAIADRLIPAQRGFVLCRFRATDKEFFKTAAGASTAEAVGMALANAQENEVAQQNRLLYRDGQRFSILSSPEVFPAIKQLMPSTGEQNDYYQRERKFGDYRTDRNDPDYHRITPEDLDYAAAQRRQLGALNDYARVLVICWGLHDRTDLFGSTSIPKFANWLDPGFQAARLALISKDMLLGEEREDYAAYRNRMNELLGPGTTVVLNTRVNREHEAVPALFGQPVYDRHRQESVRSLIYVPTEHFVIGRVRQQAGKLYVEVQAKHDTYRDNARIIDAKWYVKPDDENILVLDRLHAPDLTYYLTSRRQRRQYAAYVGMFQKARTHVAARDAEEEPIRAFLRQSVRDARLPHDPDALDEGLTTAIATWRTARADKGLVLPGQKNWDTARKALLNALHSALASHAPRIAAVEALCREEGRTPLRLTHKGNDTWHLYATPVEAERDPRLGAWPWVADLDIVFAADGTASVRSVSPFLLRKQPGELIVQEWPEAAAYEKAEAPESMTPAAITKALDGAEDTAARASLEPSAADLVALAEEGMRWSRRQKGGSVVRPVLSIPVGTASVARVTISRTVRPGTEELGFRARDKDRYIDTFIRDNDAPCVLMAEVDLWGYCYAHTRGRDREAVEASAISHYQNKEAARNRLLSASDPKKGGGHSLHTVPLRAYAPFAGQHHIVGTQLGGALPLKSSDGEGRWFIGNVEGKEQQAWKKTFGNTDAYWGRHLRTCRITSLSAVGARLFPSLTDACERPTRALETAAPEKPSPKPPTRRR